MQSSGSYLLNEIEVTARGKQLLPIGGTLETYFSLLGKFKCTLDMHNQNNTRPPKDLCVLYRRFIIACNESVIPEMHKIQFQQKNIPRQITFLQTNVRDSEQKVD